MNLKAHKNLIIAVVVFGIIYSLLSFVNHYFFRTFALDLGLYTNALYDYIHFQFNDSTVFKEIPQNILADHFDLYLIIFSPLSLIFKTYTLLVIQVIALLFGGIGVYKYFQLKGFNPKLALPAALSFYVFFGVYSALSFDYHSNVVAASLVPWFFYYVRQQKTPYASLFLFLILIGKENMSLWMIFVSLGLLIEYRKEVGVRNFLIFATIFSGVYFILVTQVIMPWFNNGEQYPHFHYDFLGDTPFEALKYLVQHPIESFKTLFVNHTNHPLGDGVKAELHLLLLLSGLPLLLFKPNYFLMLVPIYFQKLFHNDIAMWGVHGQYSIEFVPILSVGVFSAIQSFKKEKLAKRLAWFLVFSTLGGAIRVMDNTVVFLAKTRIRVYKSVHYTKEYPVAVIHELMDDLPKDAVISAQSPFIPHLALRNNIYQFPIIKDAEYLLYSHREAKFPLNEDDFDKLIKEFEQSTEWEVLYKTEEFTLLKRR